MSSGATGPTSSIDYPHRRKNLLNGEWVLVSPHRNKRPWLGQTEPLVKKESLAYDPHCFLCPGNLRSAGEANPDYKGVYVFKNDFPALLEAEKDSEDLLGSDEDIFQITKAHGECRVICYSPHHDRTLANLEFVEQQNVVRAWMEQFSELSNKYLYVQIFENRGEMMGCSNPHPHGQIWAVDHIPSQIAKEAEQQAAYFERNGRILLLDYVERELVAHERIVCCNSGWVALVPFWASWPFEILLLPRSHRSRISELTDEDVLSLVQIQCEVLKRYDALFATSFPYSFGWHNAPKGINGNMWQLHAHYFPPLLRSATVRKFMVGYEMLCESQRDITPESAAHRLRSVSI